MPRLEVWVKSASGLKGPDLLDVPDPFCKVFMDDVELLKTEYRKNEVDPVWDVKRSVNLTVPKNQLKFEIWDKDRFSSEDFVGDAVMELDDGSGSPVERALHLQRKGKDVGTLAYGERAQLSGLLKGSGHRRSLCTAEVVRGEEVGIYGLVMARAAPTNMQGPFKLNVWVKSASGLKGPDLLDVPDPYVLVKVDDVQLMKTKHLKNDVNPVWDEKKSVTMTVAKREIHFTVMDKDRFTRDDFVGDAEMALDVHAGMPHERALHLMRKGEDVGVLFVQVECSGL